MRPSAFLALLNVLILPSFLFGQNIIRDTIQHNNLDRSYILYVPANYEPSESWPLVMALHGGGDGNGESLFQQLHFHEVADTANFICVFPNGYANQWADGRGVTTPDQQGVDDVQFLNDLLDIISLQYPFDNNNVFVAGVSNGGMMVQRLACESTSAFRAFATIIASMPDSIAVNCEPTAPVPMLIMNGTEDILVPYGGGPLHPLTDGRSVIGTDATVQFWKVNNSCTPDHEMFTFQNIDFSDGSTVHYKAYNDCNDSSEVVLYRIEGAGHTIPGMEATMNPRPLVGYVNYDIDAAIEIWHFFRTHRSQATVN
ncbi:MAG: PHB depolymerase family esterase, partial [Bacteroidota bacterium]